MGIDEEEGSHICLRLKLNDLKEKIEFKGYIFDDEKYEIISQSKWMISETSLVVWVTQKLSVFFGTKNNIFIKKILSICRKISSLL